MPSPSRDLRVQPREGSNVDGGTAKVAARGSRKVGEWEG